MSTQSSQNTSSYIVDSSKLKLQHTFHLEISNWSVTDRCQIPLVTVPLPNAFGTSKWHLSYVGHLHDNDHGPSMLCCVLSFLLIHGIRNLNLLCMCIDYFCVYVHLDRWPGQSKGYPLTIKQRLSIINQLGGPNRTFEWLSCTCQVYIISYSGAVFNSVILLILISLLHLLCVCRSKLWDGISVLLAFLVLILKFIAMLY